MKPRTAALIGLAIFVGLTTEQLIRFSLETGAPALPPPAAPSAPALPATPLPATPAPAPSTPQPGRPALEASVPALPPVDPLRNLIGDLLQKLQLGTARASDLDQLKQALTAAHRPLAIKTIVDFLATGQDSRTGADFTPGPGGTLSEAPSLRVALMDLLGNLSKSSGSGEAAALARTLLETKTSADEWAISLRNIAWHEPQATTYLAAKTLELLSTPAWLEKPSAGLLEGFDVAVFTKDPKLIPALTALMSSPELSLQRAAAVALDRLSEAAPLSVMNYLNSHPELVAERPMVRADFFAKADLSQPLERQALETYLNRPDVTLREKTKTLKALATQSSFVSDNLLTTAPPPTDDSARLEALSKATQDWLKSGRFPELNSAINGIQVAEPLFLQEKKDHHVQGRDQTAPHQRNPDEPL